MVIILSCTKIPAHFLHRPLLQIMFLLEHWHIFHKYTANLSLLKFALVTFPICCLAHVVNLSSKGVYLLDGTPLFDFMLTTLLTTLSSQQILSLYVHSAQHCGVTKPKDKYRSHSDSILPCRHAASCVDSITFLVAAAENTNTATCPTWRTDIHYVLVLMCISACVQVYHLAAMLMFLNAIVI